MSMKEILYFTNYTELYIVHIQCRPYMPTCRSIFSTVTQIQ